MVLMRCAHLPAVITAHNKHHKSLSSPVAASTHGDPLVRLKKKRLIGAGLIDAERISRPTAASGLLERQKRTALEVPSRSQI